jgi:hypothetical protein
VQVFSPPSTYGCVRTYPTSRPLPSFHSIRFKSVVPHPSASSQPAVCIKIQFRRRGPKFCPGDACCDRSPSPGGVAPLMEVSFGFSPTPPGGGVRLFPFYFKFGTYNTLISDTVCLFSYYLLCMLN